jgi:hypothetical protein
LEPQLHVFAVRESGTNTQETIALIHGSFAVLFSRLFIRRASNPSRSRKKGVETKSDGVKQKFLILKSDLVASGILDGTRSTALLSSWRGSVRIVAIFRPKNSHCIKSKRRDNRSAGVLAIPKVGRAPLVGGSKLVSSHSQANQLSSLLLRDRTLVRVKNDAEVALQF